MQVTVRDAQATDAAAVARLMGEMAAYFGVPPAATPGLVGEFLAFPGAGILLAESEGQPVGLLTYAVRPGLFHAAPCGLIDELFVREGARGQGVGARLVEAALALFEARGCAEASISTALDNVVAQHLYRAHGFVDTALLLERHF